MQRKNTWKKKGAGYVKTRNIVKLEGNIKSYIFIIRTVKGWLGLYKRTFSCGRCRHWIGRDKNTHISYQESQLNQTK